MSAAVYRVFDAADRLLYVGRTTDVEARLRGHELNSAWWPFYQRVEIETFATLAEASAAELQAIAAEHPRWNTHGRSDDHPDGRMRKGAMNAPWLEHEREVSQRLTHLNAQEADLLAEIRRVRRSLFATRLEVEEIKHNRVPADLEDIA